jgi:hypothetical protein
MERGEDLKRGNHAMKHRDHEVYSSGVLPKSPDTDAFWRAFRRHAGLDHDNYVVGSFGDGPEMATELADLVIGGIKRARPAWPETTGKVASRHRGSAISSSCLTA